MFLNIPILNLVKLVQLSFKHVKITPLLGIKIKYNSLISLKSIDYFVEMFLTEEERIVP